MPNAVVEVLDDTQREAVRNLHNGACLCAETGTGKSRVALAYYVTECGGDYEPYKPMTRPLDLYVITTAKKRDSREWELDMALFFVKGTVDSWNNIGKYSNVHGAFFIFDEQRTTGGNKWAKTFIKLARKNRWIMLSATPGDKWDDYMPLFLANGFYRSKGEFTHLHCVYNPYLSWPKVEKWINTDLLVRNRGKVLVKMPKLCRFHEIHYDVPVVYDEKKYKTVVRDRWNPYDDCPIMEGGKRCYLERRVVNEDHSRLVEVSAILLEHPKIVVFYNFDYELELLRELMSSLGVVSSEWNGHKHELLPTEESWAYLVQYDAGCEGWNCVTTDTIVFYSQSYSYRKTVQAEGRITRRNTPFKTLYFYHLKSRASIDLAISNALLQKEDFNEKAYLSG